MGLNEAFTPNANFELLSNIKPLFINEVIQKTFLDINETGTTASSASMVDFLGLESDSKPVEMKCDRPYLIFLSIYCPKIKNHIILFSCKIENP